MNNNISFKSTYRAVSGQEFSKLSTAIGKNNFVNYPWTIKETVFAQKAGTTGIFDCNVLGITDGKKVHLYHLCPTMSENDNFNKIKNFIVKHININDPNLQAAFFGSQDSCPKSSALKTNILNLIEKLNIPCSIFSNCKDYFNVLYSSITDEWCISGLPIEIDLCDSNKNSEKILKDAFKEVKLCSLDEFT